MSKIQPDASFSPLISQLSFLRDLQHATSLSGSGGLLWPEAYADDTAECAERFLFECCWTYNEADKSVERVPRKEYVGTLAREWHRCRTTGETLIVEKSRRLIVSWVLRGLELWSMGLRAEKRVLCGLTYPKAAEHVWRIWWLFEQLRKRRPELDLGICVARGGNTAAQEIQQAILPNGSLMETLNQQGESFQGSGYAGVTMEEFSLYRQCEFMYGQAARVTEGKPGAPGGQVTIVTNASTGVEWQGLKRLESGPEHAMRGIQTGRCRNGASYFRLHYSADPAKDETWAAEQRKGTPDKEWRREMEMHEDVWEGTPVYPAYEDSRHAPQKWASGVPAIEGSAYFGGWDCGSTLRPAFVLLQVTPKPFQVHALLEVTSAGGESMEDFAPRVVRALAEWHGALWEEVRHYGDATVVTRSGANGMTARDVARRHGIEITPVSNAWAPRYAAVAWALRRQLDERTSGFLLVRDACPLLRAGFQGAYKFRESSGGESSGPGSVLLEPLKNVYSHVHDALQYPMVMVRQMVEGTGARLIREPEEQGAR